ncbi:MAG: large conductance mechanosensitive channel protein MscL, partial [Proteobacteria bacterium]
FLNNVIDFLIVGFAVFLIVKLANRVHKEGPAKPAEPAVPTTKECPFCASVIAIKAVRCPQCTSQLQSGLAT